MLDGLRKEISRLDQSRSELDNDDDDDDNTHAKGKTRSMPIQTAASLLRQEERFWMDKKGADLQSIVRSILLVGGKTAHKNHFKLVLSALGAARGGEIKYLFWDEWCWDYQFCVTEGSWYRKKTNVIQTLYFQCYRNGWLCDFYHALAGYIMVDYGLLRSSAQTKVQKQYIFPALHSVSDESVAKHVTKLIRDNGDSEFKVLNSSKSLRVGANTHLKLDPHVHADLVPYASGLRNKDNSGEYFRPCPASGVTTANSLCNWYPKAKVFPPSLDALHKKTAAPILREN